MKRRSHVSMVGLALAMVLLACMAVAGTAAAQTNQATDPVAVVKAFNAAINRNDINAARALLDPAFRKLVGPDSANAQEQNRDQFPPFSLHVTYTVKNGLIIQILDRLSPQTVQDLAALAPPAGAPAQLPKTGESGSNAAVVLLALSLLCALAGALVRRAALHHW